MAESQLSNINFIVADSEPEGAEFWETALPESFPDSKVALFKTGFDALSGTRAQEKVDFLILSWELVGMSGLVLLQKIKSMPQFHNTPFLIFSEILKETDIALAKEFGATNYLLKPFTKESVSAEIRKILENENKADPLTKKLNEAFEFFTRGNLNQAITIIEDSLKTMKGDPSLAKSEMIVQALCLQADIFAYTDTGRAEDSYKEALALNSNSFLALNGMGKIYFKTQRIKEAIEIFEKLNKLAPLNIERVLALGESYLREDKFDKAKSLFSQVNDIDPSNPKASEGLGKVAFHEGDLETAKRFFKESGKGNALAAYFNSLGVLLVSQEKYADAVVLYKNAISVMPSTDLNHFLEFNIALSLKKSGQFGAAAEGFAKSFLLNNDYTKAYSSMVVSVRAADSKNQIFDLKIIRDAINQYNSKYG